MYSSREMYLFTNRHPQPPRNNIIYYPKAIYFSKNSNILHTFLDVFSTSRNFYVSDHVTSQLPTHRHKNSRHGATEQNESAGAENILTMSNRL